MGELNAFLRGKYQEVEELMPNVMRSFKTSHVIDLKFAQNLMLENHTLEFSADVTSQIF
jgi:hypothetical protein